MSQSTPQPPRTPPLVAEESPKRTRGISKRGLPTAEEHERIRPSKQTILDDDGKAQQLKAILSAEIFGFRTKKLEEHCLEYIVAMKDAPSPHPTRLFEFLRAQQQSATEDAMVKAWRRIRNYFSNDVTTYERLKDLINVEEFVAAFKSAPRMEVFEPATATTAITAVDAPPSLPPVCISSAAAAYPTRTRSNSGGSSSNSSNSSSNNNSSGSSGSSGSSLNAVGLAKMREEFSAHFNAFNGQSWVLASGTVVDQVIAEHVKVLSHESTLHSFIVENVRVIVDLFPESDKVEVREALEQSRGRMPSLSAEELAYLALYNKSPSEVYDDIDSGRNNATVSATGGLPDKDFRVLVLHCMIQIYRTYSKNNFLLPNEQSESWYMNRLWSVFSLIFDNEIDLDYQPGQASDSRRNKERRLDDRQLPGREADGLIVASETGLEICVIVAGNKDDGPRSTKALKDMRKMAKEMKDMHDLIRARATQNIRASLKTFGIRVSGLSITLYSLRQLQGRFYQLSVDSTIAFPPRWNALTTTTILAVLAKLVAFKKELSETAAQVTNATVIPLMTTSQADEDFWATTLTTPTNSPRLAPRV
ncbi:hypothetical protein B0O80DRAFT_524748 [Mortierella sp. GBAus27b]|nr:hypothetical protein B0O80DRAFT_524748 [Mortierella sp. GBAus27b]